MRNTEKVNNFFLNSRVTMENFVVKGLRKRDVNLGKKSSVQVLVTVKF